MESKIKLMENQVYDIKEILQGFVEDGIDVNINWLGHIEAWKNWKNNEKN